MKNGSSFSYAKTMPSRAIGSNLQLVYFNLTPSNVSKLWCVFFELIAFKMNIGFPTLQSNPYSFSIAVQSWKISCHHFQSNMSPTSVMNARLVTKKCFHLVYIVCHHQCFQAYLIFKWLNDFESLWTSIGFTKRTYSDKYNIFLALNIPRHKCLDKNLHSE